MVLAVRYVTQVRRRGRFLTRKSCVGYSPGITLLPEEVPCEIKNTVQTVMYCKRQRNDITCRAYCIRQ